MWLSLTTRDKISLVTEMMIFKCFIEAIAVVLCAGFVFGLSEIAERNYDGFTVIRSLPQTERQLERLLTLKTLTEESDDNELQFWTEPRALNVSVDVLVSPTHLKQYLRTLSRWSVPSTEIISDVGKEIKRIKTGLDFKGLVRSLGATNESLKAQMSPRIFYNAYQRYSTIEAKLRELEELDSRVKLEVIGKTSEGRPLYLVKVSSDASAKKPVILFDAGHHAREWISHSTLMYVLESLVNVDMPRMSGSECRGRVSCRQAVARKPKLDLNKFDFWFIPVVNPDGYEYSHTTDRLWRKTRSTNLMCAGTDPNRNYPFHWRESGASAFSCSDIYAGPSPASEPEVRAVMSVMDNNKGRILAYLTLHAYSQLILGPYGYARVEPYNVDEMQNAAKHFIDGVKSLRETQFSWGLTAIDLYPAAGGSDDYAHGEANIRFSYTIELPDKGNKGFVLPSSEIVPVGHETLLGLSAMINSLYE